jgi:hypothetical protein
VGYRAPDMWKNALDCACTLLAPGGILLLHDTMTGGFGNACIMQDHVALSGLDLDLEERSEPIKHDPTSDSSWGRMMLMVWRKK